MTSFYLYGSRLRQIKKCLVIFSVLLLISCTPRLKTIGLIDGDSKLTQQSPHHKQEVNSRQKLNVKLVLDLPTRQALMDERWERQPGLNRQPWYQFFLNFKQVPPPKIQSFHLGRSLFTESTTLNLVEQLIVKELQKLDIDIKITEVDSWESSDNGSALSLDQLAHSLRTKSEQNFDEAFRTEKSNEPQSANSQKTIYIGLVSTPTPSFPRLSDLLWARPDVSVIVVRRPIGFYAQHPSAITEATARLMLRGIAEYLAIAPVCDGGWGGADRDELMGLLSTPSLMVSHQTAPLSPTVMRSPLMRGAQDSPHQMRSDESALDLPWRFEELSWSMLSKQLSLANELKVSDLSSELNFRRSRACSRFKVLHSGCSATSSPLKSSAASLCFSDRDRLISFEKAGLLEGPLWLKYKTTAQGLVALENGDLSQAFKRCQAIADHYPSLLASKCAGLAADQLNELSSATLYLRAYLSSHPHDIESLSRLARVLGAQGLDREAVAILRRLALEGPNRLGKEYGRVLYNLGVAEAQLNRPHVAIETWKKIAKDDPLYEPAQTLIDSLQASEHTEAHSSSIR